MPQSRVWTCCCAEEIPFDQGDLAESLVCLGPLGAGQSPYVLPHHEGQGVHWEVFKIYLRSISSLFWLDWFVQAKLFLMNQIFWKINIVIGIEDWLIWDKDRVDAVTTFSYIYIIAHYGDLHADTLTQEHPNLLVTCHLRSFLSQLSCLDGILIYHACHKISWSSLWIILEILPKGITDFAHLR